MESNTFSLEGVSCGSCIEKIEKGLASFEDFSSVKVHRNPDRLEVKSDEDVHVNEINQLFRDYDLSKYQVSKLKNTSSKNTEIERKENLFKKLLPLTLVISYLVGTVALIAIHTSDFTLSTLMSHYMAGFFLIFSFFKFLNIEGFADAFQTYDPIASKLRGYGYFYALFEVLAGVGYLFSPKSIILNSSVLLLLSISSIGVYKAVKKKSQIQCACLGTVFNLPMTKVTIVENASMIIMATIMIF